MLLSFIVEILNMRDIFSFFLDNVSVGINYWEVMATILFLPPMAPKIFLIVLVLFVSPALVGGRLLEMLAIKYINGKNISRIIPSRVFLRLFCRLIPLKTL